MGVSLGGRPEEYEGLGIPMDRRVAVFRESMAVLRQLLGGEPVDHAGKFFQLREATVRPAAPVPILVGGITESAIRRAGALADGWIMAMISDSRQTVRERCALNVDCLGLR